MEASHVFSNCLHAPGHPNEERDPSSFHRMRNVRTVTEEDLATGRYGIQDVVLPLPGTDVIYPGHDIAKV